MFKCVVHVRHYDVFIIVLRDVRKVMRDDTHINTLNPAMVLYDKEKYFT